MSEVGADPERAAVPGDMDGMRADRVVAGVYGISRAAARNAVDSGKVTIDGEPVAAKDKLAAGTILAAVLPEAEGPLQPLDARLEIRYESADVLVVDKPAGLVVHPGAGHRNDTLASILIHHYPALAALGESHRWGLVHRLDRDTSGLLLVARSPEAHADLQQQLKERSIQRTYVALVGARVEPATGTVEAPIGRDPEQPTRMALRQNGRFARTHYRRLAAWGDISLMEVKLDTGRTHQIRVHLSSIGAPLVGDKTYGAKRAGRVTIDRVWLHAARLTFQDPSLTETTTVVAPLPAELVNTLDDLGEPDDGAVSDAGLVSDL
ncbi:MAG: RluA family pseudouridine synthase [Acidimicrobiia bacterium]|nr:RluA family pseudouridine synthase [Acidimicrobiia bacterium]